MNKKRKIIYTFLLIDFCVASYIFVFSTYIQYKSEKMVYEMAQDFISEKIKRYYRDKKIIVNREIDLFTERDDELINKLKGNILLQVESNGEAWYLNPDTLKKHYMGSPSTAYNEIKNFAIEISEDDLEKFIFEKKFPKDYLGKFIKSKNNIYFYINPKDLGFYEIKNSDDALECVKQYGIGISNENIRKIEVAPIKIIDLFYL